MTFKEFVQARMEPFAAMQLPYGMNLDAILKADLNWLLEAAGVPPDMKRDHAQSWLKVEGAKKVKEVCDELMTFQDVPLLPTVRAVWNRLHPDPADARRNCERCEGAGWIQVDGPFGLGAAFPCTHAPATEADTRMGLKIPPAMRTRYMREERESRPRAEVWQGTGGKVDRDEMKRVNLATIGRILDGV